MELFSRKMPPVDPGDLPGTVRRLVEHINYLQEQCEYAYKRLGRKQKGSGENGE